jgi:PAS domain S-box-containing protein
VVDDVSERSSKLNDDRLEAILDRIEAGVTVQDEQGSVLYANMAAARMAGLSSPAEMLAASHDGLARRFEMIDERGNPLSVDALPGRRLLAGQDAPPTTVGFRDPVSGDERWSIVQASELDRDADGRRLVVNTLQDVTSQVQAGRASEAAERQFRDLTDSAPMLVWMADVDRRRSFVNAGWLAYTGRTMADELGDGWLTAVHPADRARCEAAFAEAFDERRQFEIEYRLRRHDGGHRWILDIGAPHVGTDGEFVGFIGSAVDIEDRRRAGDLARLVADAVARLDENLELDETVAAAAKLAIPELADWCLIELLEADGSFRRAAAVAADARVEGMLHPIRQLPTDRSSARVGVRVADTLQTVLIEDLGDEATLREETGGNEALAEMIRATGAKSAIVAPLVGRGTFLGIMFFVVGPDRTYGPTDVAIVSELARRAAQAVSNARLYAAEQSARQAAEAAVDRMERLQRVTRALVEAPSRSAVVGLIVREGRQALGADAASVAIVRDGGLELVADVGYGAAAEAFRSIPADSTLPIAVAAREDRPIWMADLRTHVVDDDEAREVLQRSPNSSACALPLTADGQTYGVVGLSFREPQSFDEHTRSLFAAYADLCAQALARVDLSTIRERLVADLEAERARLETLLRQLPDGLMIAEAPSGRVVLRNDRLETLLGVPAWALDHIAGGEAYRGFDTEGRELQPDEWPLARAVRGETVPRTELELLRADGSRIWIEKRATPVFDRDGRVIAGIATIVDVSKARQRRENQRFLAKATELLASSLDYQETIRRVAELAVPRVADWCVAEVVDEAGVPRRLAVAHVNPAKLELARQLQERYPPQSESARGSAAVLRTGKPDMMTDIPVELLEGAATDEEHLALLRELELNSYMCVPLIAGGEILGTLTFIGAESGRHYAPEDLAFAESIAERAAAAISNARSFREAVRYKRVLDATLDAVVIFDPVSLRITYVNRGVTDQLGYAAEDVIDADATILVEDLDSIGIRGLVAPLIAGELDARTVTLSYRHRDGHSIPVEVLLQHVSPPDEPGRIVAVARDIADRLEAQAKLRRLAESEHARAAELNAVILAIGDGIFVCAPDGRIALANPAAEEIFPDVQEQTYADVLDQLVDPEGEAPALGRLGGPVELRAKNGDERWIELSTYPVVRPEDAGTDHGTGTIVMLRDVTEARQRQAIRDTFIGVLSHELRTPVTTIFAGSKVLAREEDHLPAETRREIFNDIVVESERLHRLVEDVIAMTRFGESEGEVGNEPVLIQRVLPTVIRSEATRWPGITFNADLPPGLPTAFADPTYVEQVIRNLLSNAAKYGGRGTTVDVVAEADENEVRIRIIDDGPGFPAEESDRVFELFFRSSATATAAGAGIGLFVCARLVRAMGGRIWATPRPGGGAEFGFTLRVLREDGEGHIEPQPEPGERRPSRRPSG